MMSMKHHKEHRVRNTCCPCGLSGGGITRRNFLQSMSGAALLATAVTRMSWSAVSAAETEGETAPKRRPLMVKPVLVYSTPARGRQTSWRSWGGIQTEEDAGKEIARIQRELGELGARADFPLKFQPIARVKKASDLSAINELSKADIFLVYAAGGWMDIFDAMAKLGKDMIFFCRHKSGPVYLWYEIISPRYLRQHTDALALKGIDDGDVVVDSQDEILWRLRALCGLRNTLGTRIIAVGGPGAWSQPEGVVPNLVKEKWKFDIQSLSYEELSRLIKEARQDKSAVDRAVQRAAECLKAPGITLETERRFVDNAFLLEQVFRGLMNKAGCQAITINECMGTIMPIAETTACLTLSLLNDASYLAFCESDFVVIPSGVLLANISGKPVFLNDPTYPHDGIITLAHCTAPRRMEGKKLDKARIMTHFESDYGAAPKVEMPKGQMITNIVPDFEAKRWLGLLGEIVDAPFMDICRSQIDIRFTCDSRRLAERMPGFHWMTGYGDYCREVGYALRRVGIQWEFLS